MMNKGRKSNTSRAGGGGSNNNNNRSSPRSRAPIAEGVYNNSHFLHAAALQVGNNVRVKTKGGVVVEGIFRTFSETFHIALEVPHRYQNGADDKKINVDTVQDNLIIKLSDIVTIEAKDVDLEYATRDTFATDTAIASRHNGPNREKELQPWMDMEGANINGDLNSVTLELDTKTNGWDANEMFQLNEKEHGIKTTYKDNLESYTVQIDRKDTMDFRRQEIEAERIANEIESNPKTQERLDVEDGDEEAAFAAVIRPEDAINNVGSTNNNNNINSNTNMNPTVITGNSDKMTPPPQQQQQAHQQQKYIPKQQRQSGGNQTGSNQGAGKMMPNSKMYSKPMQTSGGIPSIPSQQPVQQTINAGGFKTMTINPLPQNQYNLPPPSHYQQSQQQQQQQQHQREDRGDGNERNKVNGGESSNSSNSSSSNKSSMQPQQQPPQRANNIRIMNPPIPVSFSEPPPPLGASMGKPLSMHIPPPHLQQSGDAQQAQVQPQIHVVQQPVTVLPPTAVVVAHQIHAVPQPQRQPRSGTDGPIMRTRNEEIRQLRQFHNDFQIAPPHQGIIQQMVPQEIVISSGPQSLENSQHINKHQGQPPHVNHHITHHPTPSSTPHQDQQQKHGSSTTPPQANTPQQQIINNVNSSNNSSTGSVNSNSNSSETTVSANNNNNNGEKAALGTKKFTLNPQAKPFTPRTPSTPTPSRPHTPQTPGHLVQQQPQQQAMPPPQQQLTYAPAPSQLVYCLVPSQQRPTPPPTLTRKTQFHQFQVTQATGQPIFNPPVPQQVMPYHPSQMQTVQSQSYPQAIRMYPHDGQQQPHITASYLVPTPPSTTPSPGQGHQPSFHPQQSQSAGPQPQAFQPQGQYVMLMPSNGPPFVYNQHNPQFQIVSNALPQQQQQHPQQ